MARKALGRGLGALISSEGAGSGSARPPLETGESVQEVPIEKVVPSPLQPRKTFTPDQLQELSDSILERGIIQPLIVRSVAGKYELIAGERRWRASQMAGLKQVPVIVRQAGDLEVLEMALVENLQRADLNPIEEAEGYAQLAEVFKLTQEQIARQVGKSRASIANALRLRSLAPEVAGLVRQNRLSVGHAKVLLGLPDKVNQEAAAREIIRRDLSVRQTEQLVKQFSSSGSGGAGDKAARSRRQSAQADWRDIEQQLQRAVGTKVRLVGTADKGKIEIDYYQGSDLDRILSVLGVRVD